ncbi:UDP-glucuronosyl/UDP-glucosyltransferase protein, partial [Dioscorea alata]
MNSSRLTIMMLSWLAHGHISPFLELSKRLSSRGMMVYLCSTPINLDSIRESLDEKVFPSIKLVEIQLPSIPGLAPHIQSTKHLPPHLMALFKEAFDFTEPYFEQLLDQLQPNLLFYDIFQPWVPKVTHLRNIPSLLFLTTSAICSAYLCHLLLRPNEEEFPFPEFHDVHKGFGDILRRMANGISNRERFLMGINRSLNYIIIKTFGEIESTYIDYLAQLTKKEIISTGPLLPNVKDEIYPKYCDKWLSTKEMSSVVLVSFGSEYFLSQEQLEEVALGLELSHLKFIWIVRFLKEEMVSEKSLPLGFQERLGEDKALLVDGWASQREILTHPSIGGFLTHCGWSSVMEGMGFGVPIIALPMQLDQPFNAKLVTDLGVGVEVTRTEGMVGRFSSDQIAKGIQRVMIDEEGVHIRRKSKEMAKIITNHVEKEEIDVLVQKMVAL